ncbi:5-hydroxytryptamine receptor 3A-like [Polymixia lowei]
MLRRLDRSLVNMALLLIYLKLACGHDSPKCTERRCLAEMLIDKNMLSQPQSENCTQIIHVPFIEYQTLSVDTKKLRFDSRLQAIITWRDPDLAWDKSVYPYDLVVLPVNKVWTPVLHVTNAINTIMKHGSRDLLVYSNGTLMHKVIINAVVDCEVNLFRYPFAEDNCPVAIQAWSSEGCGMQLKLGTVRLIDGNHGDWQTDRVSLRKKRDDRNYIMVTLSTRYLNPFISLVLPSILIILTDVMSFALPLGGGERNSFKVTLVLSFIMFLIILNDLLPGGSQCSPIIRTHFCICLVLLVLSMLVSMLLTRVAKDGTLLSCSRSKKSSQENTDNEERGDEESKAEVSAVNLKPLEEESQLLRKVVSFLDAVAAVDQEKKKCQDLAEKVDRICFWVYFGSV